MKAKSTIAALLAAVAGWLPLQAAQACEFSRTPWGLRVSNCKLSDLTRGRYDATITLDPTQGGRIPLPNLVVTDVDTTIVGTSANLSAQLANIGRLNAGAFDVQLIATITDPLNNGSAVGGMMPLPPASVPGLAVGAAATVFPGVVSLPNRSQDWDVCTIAIVDPPPLGRPAWGAVLESTESDNQWPAPTQQGCCRAYGKNPDVSGPPACF